MVKGYNRDYLMPRLKENGQLEKKMATYADATVATAALLAMAGGVPVVEHSERALLPTWLALKSPLG